MKKTVTVWLISLLFSLPDLAFAQQTPVLFEQLTAKDGLLGNNVRSIIQDRRGFLWFATYGGINRFDGYAFKGYQYDARDTTTLGGNHVIDLWEDPNGFIWAAISNGGLARLDPKTDRVKRFMANRNRARSLHTNDVTAVRGDRYGNIWVGTIEGLCRFDPKTETFTRYRCDPADPTSPSTNTMISDLHESNDGTIWVATIDHGVNRISYKPGSGGKSPVITFIRFEHNPTDPASISSNQVMDVFEDHTGTLWIGTLNGLNRFDQHTGRRTALYLHDADNPASLSSSWISQRAIAEDQHGNLWIGTNNGLNRLNPDRTHFDRFYHDPGNLNSLNDNIIRTICIDRTGIVWLGTNDAGISKFDPNRRTLVFTGYHSNQSNPMSGYNIRSICQDNTGKFWIGTEGGGIFRYDPSTRQYRNFRQTSRPNGLPTNFIGPMLKDRDGFIWVGMGSDWNSGTRGQIGRLDPKTGQVKIFLPFQVPHSYAFILNIFEDERGFMWFGTGNLGVISYDRKRNHWKQYNHDPGNPATLRGKWARAVVSDRRGHVWVGTDAGLDRLDYETGQITHFVNNPKEPNSLISNYILSLCVDRIGRLWVGTDGGLCRFDPVHQQFILYTEKNGLIDNSITNLVEDNDGNLWLNTAKGICRFSPKTGIFTAFDANNADNNYFISGNINIGATLKDADGNLYFGGKTSITQFHPHHLRFNPTKPPVVLTALRLFDKPLPGTFDRQTLTLDHDQNSLTLEFAALNYTSAAKNQYAYQLKNFNHDWVYAGTRRTVTYTNLDPGTYTFRVKGSNNDGLWNHAGTFLTIVIEPAWWQTVWFKILMLITIVGLAYAFYHYRLAQLRHIQTLRDQIARDLHDDVGGVLSSISFYSEAASAMHREGRFQDSYHLLQKIADNARTTIERMSDVVWSMRSDTNNALRLAERLESFGHELLAQRGIRLVIEAEPVLERFPLSPDVLRNLYLIGKEALHNAAKHSEATEVRLQIRQTGGKVNLEVQDNGSGFIGPGNGNGLDSMKKRADAIGARFTLTSQNIGGTIVSIEKNM
ncbi:two-component regulator propeller domain-containing protein [Larkinella sp. GY13]|uniref:ligand-binding sensor domain-containing protein n=1 Tax=Larkinella sp. GY13 TaxID=3453720 RepID=UPI003EE8973D